MKIVSLFDYTGNMLLPWAEAGHECTAYDLQHAPESIHVPGEPGSIRYIHADLTNPLWLDADLVFAFPPCDHLAVSGARWFQGKGLRKLQQAIGLFASAVESIPEGVPYMIENPVSTISTYWRKPDFIFHPYDYTGFCLADNYSKKTCLWTGNGFVMPLPCRDESLGEPDDRIHQCPPGPNRANIRSATPMGFARAVFAANGKSA